ncbi:MAG: outer membrane beta-barrel protein [Saprospiraceae bacterium]
MQSDNRNDIDPRLIDKGWHRMEMELDKVMPLQENDRRFPVWLLWLFLGISLSGIVWWQVAMGRQHGGDDLTPSVKTSPDLPSVVAESASTTVLTPAPTSDFAGVSSVDTRISTIQAARISTSYQSAVETPMTVTKNQKTAAATSSTVFPADNQTTLSLEIPTLLDTPNGATLDEATTQEKAVVSPIAGLAIEPLHSLQSVPLAASVVALQLPKQSFFVDVQFGVQSESQRYMAAGLGLTTRLAKRWGLDVGLYYQKAMPVTRALGAYQSNFEESMDLPSPSFVLVDEASAIINYDRIDIGLAANWKMLPRLSLQAGFRGGLYINGAVQFKYAYSDGTSTSGSPMLLDGLSEVDLYDEAAIGVRFDEATNDFSSAFPLKANRWHGSALMGAQYRLAKNLSLGLAFRSDLTPWPSKTLDWVHPHAWQATARYHFGL